MGKLHYNNSFLFDHTLLFKKIYTYIIFLLNSLREYAFEKFIFYLLNFILEKVLKCIEVKKKYYSDS